MEGLVHKDQVNALFNKIDEVVDSINTQEEWPQNIKCEMLWGSNKVISLNVVIKRCHITIINKEDRLYIEFKVGTHYIHGNHHFPGFFKKWLLPGVWRRWRKISNKLLKKHKEYIDNVNNKALEAQRQAFNDMYYTQFPEDIENILLDREEDDE